MIYLANMVPFDKFDCKQMTFFVFLSFLSFLLRMHVVSNMTHRIGLLGARPKKPKAPPMSFTKTFSMPKMHVTI